MKKIVVAILVLSLSLCFFGCSAVTSAQATPAPTQTESAAGMPNPVHECSAAELLEKTGMVFSLPEGAEDPVYSYIDSGDDARPISQITFTHNGVKCTGRIQGSDIPGDTLPDISGLYYDWAESSEAELGYNKAYLHLNPDAEGYVTWYDYAPGLLYCVSMDSGASAEALIALAEAVCPPVQGEASGTVGDGTAMDHMTPSFEPASFLPESVLPVTVDLNGDGKNETLSIELKGEEDFGDHTLVLTDSEGVRCECATYIQYNATLCIADIDGDSIFELLLSGDCGSDDYITYAWRWDGSELSPILFSGEVRREADGKATEYVDGAVETVDGIGGYATINLGSFTYMMGTYGSVRPYMLNGKGELAPVEGSFWAYRGSEHWLETAQELSAQQADPGNISVSSGTVLSLPRGTKLLLTGTDGFSKVYFLLEDKTPGILDVSYDGVNFSWLVSGVNENDAFVSLPYAG